MIQIKEISPEQTYNIRLKVLRDGIDLPYQFSGDFDNETFHIGAFKNDKLMGVASFMKVDNPNFFGSQYQLRGMATLIEVRGNGYGKALLDEAIIILKNKNTNILWCNAREIALDFYLKLGFEIKGNPFKIEKIGIHYLLYKEIF